MRGKCGRCAATAIVMLAAAAAGSWARSANAAPASAAGAAAAASQPEQRAATAAPEPAAPKAAVESGLLAGSEQDGVLVFQGVPYAAPPVGPLRWQPPQRPLHWSGERSATAPGLNCMQSVDAAGVSRGGGGVSEDCLTLQIFAPKGAHQAPVMVWIHGGSNVQGAGSKSVYDGTAFARDGIVLVAINYRLGPLGFFAHSALTRRAQPWEPLANYGLMDQIAALQWVGRNVAAFGGDPRDVTVFGESAGGQDVLALIAAKSARGLFARAVVESPAPAWGPMPSLADAEMQGARLAAKMGLGAGATAAQLRAIPAGRLVSEMREDDYGPVTDGHLLTQSIAKAFAGGDAAAVPLIIGSNSGEASLLEGASMQLDDIPAAAREAYAGEALSVKELGDAIFTDREFAAPVRWIARQASRRSPAWLYQFSYVRVSQRQKTPGAPHASELPYVFDSWDKVSRRAYMLPAEDRAMTALVHSCWVAFARTGVPACQGAPAWPAYTADRDELLELGLVPAVRQHFRRAQLDAQERTTAGIPGAAPAPSSHP
jgi:para-nitrobenzyl esterase